MGKAARKKINKKKQFYKDPKVEESETPVSKELLYGLDSADPKIRISTSGAISALFGDVQSDLQFTDTMESQYKANLDMILKSQLLKKIIGRATDNEYLVCMNILGALRNMCIVGGESFIAKICELNVILPLKNLLYKYAGFLKQGTENEQLITCNLYYQLFSLLTIIFDYDISGYYELEADTNQTIFDVLLSLLSYSSPDHKKLQSISLMMQIAVSEFISIIEDQFDATNPFLQQLLQLADSKEWNLRYRLINLCIDKLSNDQRILLLESILHTLQSLSIPDLLHSLSSCYTRFNEIEAQTSPQGEEKEDILDDAVASAKMDVEALDANKKDDQREVVSESEFLQQQIMDYRVVLDILSHLLSDEQIAQCSETVVSQCVSFVTTFIVQLENTTGLQKQADFMRQQLLTGIIEVEGALIPYLSSITSLTSVWTQLIKYCTISAEITSSIIKSLWTWTQVVIQHPQYGDSMNPVCFAEQISPLINLLPNLGCEDLVQLINLISSLLQPVTPSDQNGACLTEVCKQVVHVLDSPVLANNPEVLGNVLDFMMTIFGDEKYVPIFTSLHLNQYVYDATNALQLSLQKQDQDLDTDCQEYLYEILENAVRFIDWIQSGMK